MAPHFACAGLRPRRRRRPQVSRSSQTFCHGLDLCGVREGRTLGFFSILALSSAGSETLAQQSESPRTASVQQPLCQSRCVVEVTVPRLKIRIEPLVDSLFCAGRHRMSLSMVQQAQTWWPWVELVYSQCGGHKRPTMVAVRGVSTDEQECPRGDQSQQLVVLPFRMGTRGAPAQVPRSSPVRKRSSDSTLTAYGCPHAIVQRREVEHCFAPSECPTAPIRWASTSGMPASTSRDL